MKDFTDSLIEDIIDEASLNYWDQEQKMDAWHNGGRGLNIKACSDSKLELNWKICKAKGYANEAQQLEAEGRARGLAWARPQQTTSQPQNNLVNVWQKMILTSDLFNSIMGKQILDREKNDPMMIVVDFLGQNLPFENKIRLITIALILAIILKCNKCVSEIKNALGIDNHQEVKTALKDIIGRVLADEQIKTKLEEIKKELENANESLDEKIVHLNNGDWQVQSEKGKNMGTYDTKKEAEKRLGQVEYFKHLNEDLDKNLEEKVRAIIDEFSTEGHSKLNILEYTDGYDGFKEKFDEEEIDFGKFIYNDLSDEEIKNGRPVITFLLSGGLNGSGKWEDYLDDISALFIKFKQELGLHAIIYKVDTDIADDVWTAEVLLYATPKEEVKEGIEKHDTLNPKLFDENNHLRPEVREKLLQIADEFIKGVKDDEVKFILKDVKLVGSNASYNYNPDSDMDLHLVADTESLGCPDDLYPIIYNLYKSAWNSKFTPTIHEIPVELYVETEADKSKEEVKAEEPTEKLEERAMTDTPFDSEAKVGDKIKIHHMAGEDTTYDGAEGTIEHIDGIGQLHGTWGGLAVIPGVDEFEIITEELTEAKKEEKNRPWIMQRTEDSEPEFIGFAKDEDEMIDILVDTHRSDAVGKMTTIDVLDYDIYLYMKEHGMFDEEDEEKLDAYFAANESVEETKRLIGEEEDAEKSYQKAIDNPESTEKEIELYKHIKDEETEHKEELNNLLNGEENPIEEAMNRNALVSNGMYSVLDDKWIKEPVATEVPEVNQEEIDKALAPWLLRYNEILKTPTIEAIESFMDDLYKARQTSIATEGEYNPTNHAFKSLRAAGNLDNLRELKRALKEKELSLE